MSGVKICSRCRGEFPLSFFHKRKDRPIGVAPHCKACDSKRGRGKKKVRRPPYSPEADRRLTAKHPESRRAKNIVAGLRQRGKILPGPCLICGEQDGVEAHHCDYNKPREIVWLCRPHHKAWHRVFIPGGLGRTS